jgi:hypothetical protein
MKYLSAKFFAASAFCTALCANLFAPQAALASDHPAYLHGLSDLRVAHQLLAERSFRNVNTFERRALKDIDQSYRFAESAAIWDNMPLTSRMPVDANLRHRERLVRAEAALRRARYDFTRYESNGADKGWQHGAVVWVDRALRNTRQALKAQNLDIDR